METAMTIGLDLGKSVFQVHGVDAGGAVVVQRRLTRSKLLAFFAKQAQVTGDTSFAHWTKPASTYHVRLSHGAFGSYDLAVIGKPGVYKVRRV